MSEHAKSFTATAAAGDADEVVMQIPGAEPPDGVMAHLINIDPARGLIASIIHLKPGTTIPAHQHEAFAEAQRLYVEHLRAPSFAPRTPEEQLHCAVIKAGGDPLPYGIAPNQRVLESAIDHAMSQEIITHRPALQTLFAPTS